MKLVSAAKLRRAQEAAVNGRGFSVKLKGVLDVVCSNLSEDFKNPLLEKRSNISKRRIIVIAGERGLCGAYNTSVFNAVEAQDLANPDAELDFVPIGRRSVAYAKQNSWKISSQYEGLGEDAGSWPIAEIVENQIRDFRKGECDEVVLYYTEFISVMTQQVKREVLLPFSVDAVGSDSQEDEEVVKTEAKFDPRPEELVAKMIPLLINTQLTQAGLDSKASEHASRMTAMDSATRNADELTDTLKLFYNRARQSAITTELIDIVGGAEAQN
jgi:F-type H+-transporting ATPase subunit gamma